MTEPIVVGVDGSPESVAAAHWAAAVAQKYGAPLELVHGSPGTGRRLADAAMAIRAAVLAAHEADGAEILRSVEDGLRAEFGDLEVITLTSDEPIDQLLTARSRVAQLIVLGSEEITPPRAVLVGSTTLAVAGCSACPVLAWRGDHTTPTDRRIVLGVDGDRTGTAALQAAFAFAERFGVEIYAVHCWSPWVPPVGAIVPPYAVDWDGLETLKWESLLKLLEPWTQLYPTVAVKYFVEHLSPGKALLEHTKDAQLVVVGSRGRDALAGTLLGSVSQNLLHHAQVPVMVCPSDSQVTDVSR